MQDNDFRRLPALYALTGQGLTVALRLKAGLGGTIYVPESLAEEFLAAGLLPDTAARAEGPASGCGCDARVPRCPLRSFKRLPELLRERFEEHDCHIFITAAGIAVRALAPLLRGKHADPAVLVLDQRGRFVVSLLSGHCGGANAMAVRVAAVLGAVPVITTATDVEGLPALDVLAQEQDLFAENPVAFKKTASALLAGRKLLLHDPDDFLGIAASPWEGLFQRESEARVLAKAQGALHEAVIVTECLTPPLPETALLLRPRVLWVGIGCRRGTTEEELLGHIQDVLAASSLAPASLAGLASIEAKQYEPGLVQAARTLALPLRFMTAEELAAYPVTRPSPKALERFGIQGVCEPAALAAAGRGARLIVPKTSGRRVTLAVARASVPDKRHR